MTKTDTKLKVGIIGCGGIAQVIHIPILTKIDTVEILGICDLDERKSAVISERFNIPNFYTDIEDMFRELSLDVVFILTPPNTHLPMSLISLKNGAHIFIERPIARNYKETIQIHNAAEKNDRHVMVGMHSRFRNDIRTIKGFVDNGELGKVNYIKADWLQSKLGAIKQPWLFNKNISGGGVLMDLGIQLIDTYWWLADKPKLLWVDAVTNQMDNSVNVEDFISCQLMFENNLLLDISASWHFPLKKDRYHVEIFGENGRADITKFKIEKILRGKILDITPPILEQNPRNLFHNAYVNEIRHFISFLNGIGSNLEAHISDAIEVMEIIDLVYAALKSGKRTYAK